MVRHWRTALLGSLLLTGASTQAHASALFDFTRTWTQCTAGSANACAEVSVRTVGLAEGGSHVSIGLTNLQGTSLHDNLVGSLLTQTYFTMTSAGAAWHSGDLVGAAEGGASGPDRDFRLSASGTAISLGSIAQWTGGLSEAFTYHDYSCVNAGNPSTRTAGWWTSVDCEPTATYTGYRRSDQVGTTYGIAGANAEAGRSQTTLTGQNRPHSYDQGYQRQSYSCGFISTCYEYLAGPNTVQHPAIRNYYSTSRQIADGSTAGEGAAIWFSFSSANLYDVRTFASARTTIFDTQAGVYRTCDSAVESGCTVLSDVTIDNLQGTTVTPEPATLGFLAMGLGGLAAARRRRRAGAEAQG